MEPSDLIDPQGLNKPAHFNYITENEYILPLVPPSEDQDFACDCELDPDLGQACGKTCLKHLFREECGSMCHCGEKCTNRSFQRANYAEVSVFNIGRVEAIEPLSEDEFVMEYCGEVCTSTVFEERKANYDKEKQQCYFMSLNEDQILDATRKGNISRYIKHSCTPNCETQKWTVNGRPCIGIFTLQKIAINEELTIRHEYCEVAQKCCYCEHKAVNMDLMHQYSSAAITEEATPTLPPALKEKIMKEITEASQDFLRTCDYTKLCCPNMLSFCKESTSLQEGPDFAELTFYKSSSNTLKMLNPRVQVLGEAAGVMSFVMQCQVKQKGGKLGINETKVSLVWEKRSGDWKCVHMHTST